MASMEVTELRKLTQGTKLYEISPEQVHNEVESVTHNLEDDDIVANSIQKILNEILQDIGDIFVREKLFTPECEMILDSLEEKIKKNRRKGRRP